MSLLRVISRLPLPRGVRSAWQDSLIDQSYSREIAAARKANDHEKVESLESQHRFEIALNDEDEDAYLTKQLLKKARSLRIPLLP